MPSGLRRELADRDLFARNEPSTVPPSTWCAGPGPFGEINTIMSGGGRRSVCAGVALDLPDLGEASSSAAAIGRA